MIRRLMASTAMLALLTAGAVNIAQAQDTVTEQPAVTHDTATEQPAITEGADVAATTDAVATEATAAAPAADANLTPEEPTIATAFIGTSVYSSEDPESDNIGEVNDLIIGDNGMITHAVVGVGGFLGIGEKDVAVPFEELQVVEQDGDIRLIYAATREQLEAAEQFDRTAYDPRAREAAEQAAQDEAMAPDTGMAPAPLEEPAAPAENTAAAPAEDMSTAPSTDIAAAPAEELATDTAATEDLAATEEPAADATATADTAAAEEPAADAAATEDMAATEEPAADAATTEDMAAAPAGDADIFLAFAPEQIRATSLIGQEVYGSDGASIGEISDLIFEDEGGTRAAIVDVGGFLGVGEKPVAVPFDQIQFTQDGDQQQATVAYAQADLEGLPTYEYPADDVAATDVTTDTDVAVDTTTETPAVETEGAAMTGTGFAPITQDFSANELLGAIVYGEGDENIGEVNDVVFDQSGAIDAVLVDVGGFLGVGEKQVALNFDTLNVQQDADGNVELQVNATQEQLEGAAAYEVVAQ